MIADTVFLPRDLPLWHEAKPYLDVRNNDEHTIIAYALAKQFLTLLPEADESIVLPAILLHDVGWKRIDPDLLLLAIGRKPTRPDLVRDHELHGTEIARGILERHRPQGVDIEAVLEIIDGHDTTPAAKSINDAVVKDADKGWRCTPHGMRTISSWYGVSMREMAGMLEEKSNPHMLTEPGRAFAQVQTEAVKAELMIEHYLGHPPEFAEIRPEMEGNW